MATLSTSLTSLLDAVNQCLAAIGELPVTTIDNSETPDVAEALNAITTFDRRIQARSWSWNRNEGQRLLPDGDGFIALPLGTLRVDNAYILRAGSNVGEARVVQRGTRLFNQETRSYNFTGTEGISCDLTIRQAWEDLPQPARDYIAISAAQHFQGTKQVSATVDRILDRAVLSALAILEQSEDEVSDNNQVTGNASVLSALHGRGVRRRS